LSSWFVHHNEKHQRVCCRVPKQAKTIWDVLRELRSNPGELLLRQWNWKSAAFSSVIRAFLFLFANLTAGWRAAAGAMAAEFLYRAITSGFYGSLTQAFRKAEPACMAAITVLILLPLVSHSLEFAIHRAHGTPKLLPSRMASRRGFLGLLALSMARAGDAPAPLPRSRHHNLPWSPSVFQGQHRRCVRGDRRILFRARRASPPFSFRAALRRKS
jgi:hypothetical protein